MIPAVYQTATIKPFFGNDASPYPNGIPFIQVLYSQPPVAMTWLLYGDESDPSPYPFPANAPIEGSANAGADTDRHALVLQTAGGGQTCKLYETWQAQYNGNGTWSASNGAMWDLSTNNLRPFGWTSGDAAGLPIMPLTVNYDEVASGKVVHPMRFTLNPYAGILCGRRVMRLDVKVAATPAERFQRKLCFRNPRRRFRARCPGLRGRFIG